MCINHEAQVTYEQQTHARWVMFQTENGQHSKAEQHGMDGRVYHYKHLALALAEASLPALDIGASGIAGTQPQHCCRRYYTHPPRASVHTLLEAAGTSVGAGDIAAIRRWRGCR